MKTHPFVARMNNKCRARRVAKLLALGASRVDNRRYYQALYDATFFIVTNSN
jgi:hypothetical protein